MVIRPTDDVTKYWGAVKFDLPYAVISEEFNDWYNFIHAPGVISKDGYFQFFRTQELRDTENQGRDEQEYWAIYVMDDPSRMQVSAQPRPPDSHGDPKRLLDKVMFKLLTNWERPFYRVLSESEGDDSPGVMFCRDEFDVEGPDAERVEFERYCALEHLPRLTSSDGIHRGWLLRLESTEYQIGADPPARYMRVLEIDLPDVVKTILSPEMPDEKQNQGSMRVVPRGCHFAEILMDSSRLS